MKEQYVGDVNDYRKYSLLRHLANAGLRIGVCWMLTPPDGGTDGGKTAYLSQPEQWRHYEPDVFDLLKRVAEDPATRRLREIEESGIILNALFFNRELLDGADPRRTYFEVAWGHLKPAQLIFFDPDNGLDVRGKPIGRSGSSKYIFRAEVEETYRRGHSALIYQHYPRHKPRDQLIADLSADLAGLAPRAELSCFTTSFAAFLLVAHPDHDVKLRAAAGGIPPHWRPRFVDEKPVAANGDGRFER